MSQPLFMLCITQPEIENIQKLIPNVVIVHVYGKDIGVPNELLLVTPKPQPPVAEDVVELPPVDAELIPEEKIGE